MQVVPWTDNPQEHWLSGARVQHGRRRASSGRVGRRVEEKVPIAGPDYCVLRDGGENRADGGDIRGSMLPSSGWEYRGEEEEDCAAVNERARASIYSDECAGIRGRRTNDPSGGAYRNSAKDAAVRTREWPGRT